MEPALLGSLDEPDEIARIDLQPLQDRWGRNEAANKQGIANCSGSGTIRASGMTSCSGAVQVSFR